MFSIEGIKGKYAIMYYSNLVEKVSRKGIMYVQNFDLRACTMHYDIHTRGFLPFKKVLLVWFQGPIVTRAVEIAEDLEYYR